MWLKYWRTTHQVLTGTAVHDTAVSYLVVSKLKSDITMRCDNASENHVKLNTDQPETESSDVSPSIAIDQ